MKPKHPGQTLIANDIFEKLIELKDASIDQQRLCLKIEQKNVTEALVINRIESMESLEEINRKKKMQIQQSKEKDDILEVKPYSNCEKKMN